MYSYFIEMNHLAFLYAARFVRKVDNYHIISKQGLILG